jgi:hypothetical protein
MQLRPVPSSGQDRRDLASRVRGDIGAALGLDVSTLVDAH